DAVGLALSLDQEDRPANAALLAEAIANGARGIEPAPTARTRNLEGTAATRVLSGRGAPTAQTRVATGVRGPAPARPRQLEPRRPPPAPANPTRAARPPRPRPGRTRPTPRKPARPRAPAPVGASWPSWPWSCCS